MTRFREPLLREGRLANGECPPDEKQAVKWLEEQPIGQVLLAREQLNGFLERASQPRHSSGNACIKLCHFIEQCRRSKSLYLQEVAYSQRTCIDLFNFFVDWNEKNQNRSMRQILELIASLITKHPERDLAESIKIVILRRLVSIITHQASQPLVKPAFKSLEYFLAKRVVSAVELSSIYLEQQGGAKLKSSNAGAESWDDFVSEVFDWINLPDISPAAGKFLVTLFRELRKPAKEGECAGSVQTEMWQKWIRAGLSKYPDALENIKNYLFPALFKLDREGSLIFLEELNIQRPMSTLGSQDLTAHSFLQLAALEAGKKAGLVEEPDAKEFQKSAKSHAKVVSLQEAAIGPLLIHSSGSVRSLAFSVLVSSSSSIKPFSKTVLDSLQRSLPVMHADTDAKFRNEVLSNTKQLVERFRGATALLVREIDNLSYTPNQEDGQTKDASGPNSPLRNVTSSMEMKVPGLLEDRTKRLVWHEKFLEWYVDFLLKELLPTCSYQRHITALRAIVLLVRSGVLGSNITGNLVKTMDNSTVWPYQIKFFTPAAMRLLLDLLMDPFEDVRDTATSILKLGSRDCFTLTPMSRRSSQGSISRRQSTDKDLQKLPRRRPSQAELLEAFTQESKEHWNSRPLGLLMDFIARAEGLSKRTGRADYADGVARAYELLYGLLDTESSRIDLVEDLVQQLERKVSIAEKDLARAVLIAPVHGQFAALSFVWEVVDHYKVARRASMDLPVIEETCRTWDDLQWRILYACSRIWEAVKDVLCNDSPEGHLPQDLDYVDDIDTKDVLSYSFRATHEASNLMRAMINKISSRWQDGSPILPSNLFTDIGNLTFNQLASLRHRGAFSTVSLTFARCCQLAKYQIREETHTGNLIDQWYQGALSCIYEQASTTRRSAGIPALLTGILSADSDTPTFLGVMTDLKNIAKQNVELSENDETSLPQVHATNCLKEIFKSSLLGKRAESHIADCLQIAADSLTSEIWAIRNCGLLLLRSLIDSLFGTSESKLVTEAGWDGRSIRLSYDKYPALPELLLRLLDTETQRPRTKDTPVIGAVESVFPALDIIRRAGPPELQRKQIYDAVSSHLGSKVWHIRELAARTICTLILHDEWLPSVTELVQSCKESANRVHGVLQALRFVLERRLSLSLATSNEDLSQVLHLLAILFEKNNLIQSCPDLHAAFLEILNAGKRILSRLRMQEKNNKELQDMFPGLVPQDSGPYVEELTRKFVASAQNVSSSALLRRAITHRAVNVSALTGDLTILEMSLYVGVADTDTELTLLESISEVFEKQTSGSTLQGLSDIYIKAIASSKSHEVRSTALFSLAETLDRLAGTTEKISEGLLTQLLDLGTLLQDCRQSPQLSNAQIRISGSLMLHRYIAEVGNDDSSVPAALEQSLLSWAGILEVAGHANSDFDTRFAAASAIRSFFVNQYAVPITKALLPLLFALYDTLVDDDDDIRDLGAVIVSSLLGKSVVPLAAANTLSLWMWTLQGSSEQFAWNVIRRMTGNEEAALGSKLQLRSAELQLSEAMAEDDSLFVEEEQNLFIDEVRECQVWAVIFEKELDHRWNKPISSLVVWVLEGLSTLNTLVVKTDGPLGWTSKPSVFAQCMRIIICAKALLRYQAIYSRVQLGKPEGLDLEGGLYLPEETADDLRAALDSLIFLSSEKQLHASLVYEILGWPALVLTSSRGTKKAGRQRVSLPKRQNSAYSIL